MAGKFLSGPTGIHNTQKIRKHRLNRGVTRDMNAAAGVTVNSKNPNSMEAFRYASARIFLRESGTSFAFPLNLCE